MWFILLVSGLPNADLLGASHTEYTLSADSLIPRDKKKGTE